MTQDRLTTRDILARYPNLTEDHLRYLRKWGLLRSIGRSAPASGETFGDLALVRQVSAALAEGRSFRGIVRTLLAERHGQLAFDFQAENPPAKVIQLVSARAEAALESGGPPRPRARRSLEAERLFMQASALDGSDETLDQAAALYRRALERDPQLVPALINLGNIHYTRGHMIEAQALYERAINLSPDYFEAHFNLANVLHDLGRYDEALLSYRDALAVNGRCAEAHFYLAVTLEKMGKSAEARAHWRAYQELAPDGEWVELAKEFSE
ncbi:MAG TPA: tetratricopeptide repeat protein [Vicinamibacterales bacterium]|nr:tetratricopeptide repeat protein [Vicinamibacterales bacterium]